MQDTSTYFINLPTNRYRFVDYKQASLDVVRVLSEPDINTALLNDRPVTENAGAVSYIALILSWIDQTMCEVPITKFSSALGSRIEYCESWVRLFHPNEKHLIHNLVIYVVRALYGIDLSEYYVIQDTSETIS